MSRALRLGLGGAPLGNLYSAVSDEQARAVLAAAYADGCRAFDTAPHYGNGRSEQRFGGFLRALDASALVLSTKVGRLLSPDAQAPRNFGAYVDVLPYVQRFDYSAAGVRQSLEGSLERLGVRRVDTVYVHDCGAATHGARAGAVLREVVDAALPELERLRHEGLVGRIGVAASDWRVCVQILQEAALDCLLVAGRYTLLDQSALAELLPLCEARGVRVTIGGAFNSGILAGGVRHAAQALRFNYEAAAPEWIERARAIEEVAERHAVPLRAAALQFPLAHPAVERVLVGVKSVAHWRDALSQVDFVISPGFWDALRSAGLLSESAPTP